MTYEPGRTLKEVGAQLGVDPTMLWRWRERVKIDGEDAFPAKSRGDAADEELHRLRRDLVRITEERDILKKALAYFAKHQS